jgi:eukaryotic-like serine/threonine-protein kinase
MSPDQEHRLEEIFSAARHLPPPEREAFLQQACGGDAELRRQADSLLAAHAQAGQFLQATVVVSPKGPMESPGNRIGRYKLLEQIGEGGFGVVWMAEQEEPVRRRVALKIIKLGMDTKEVVARFEAERQALAMMDHPGIASVYDGGATDTGRPYFVMELVKGVPITEYCDANKLSTQQRLELFMRVCQAVQHAHQKGVIHRDLKPSNVLVTVRDDRPVPKVIDFGVAKATQARLTEKTVFTHFHQFIGTPAYMSPEQAGLGSLDVDTRSDIYALGVLLYELLTGRTPFDTEKLLAAGYDAVLRTIREEEPPRPSTRLSTLAEGELSAVAASRGAESARLNRLVRGELDWIVMKCLEKDRGRRYETANALALDLGHHLGNEPVSAVAPSALYTLQKLMHRHRVGLGVAGALILLLLTGVAVSTWQAVRATRAEREQARLRQQAEAARLSAEANGKKAKTEAICSAQVAQFLKDMLRSVEPGAALGQDTKLLRGILDRAAERVGKDLTNQPLVEAELKLTIGTTYRDIGFPAEAEAMTRDALRLSRAVLGETNVLTAHCLINLGSMLNRWGGPLHAQEAEGLLRQAVALQKAIPDPDEEAVIDGIDFLSRAIRGQKDKRQEAEALTREALARRIKLFGSEHMSVGKSLNNLGNVLSMEGKLEEAEASIRRAIAILRKIPGEGGPELCWSFRCLAITIQHAGRLPEAEAAYREGLEMARTVNGEDSIYTDAACSRLASILRQQGKQAEWETLSRETVERRRKLLGDKHPRLASSLAGLADALLIGERFTEAESAARECLAISEKRSPDDWEVSYARSLLGACLLAQKKHTDAEPLLEAGYQGLKQRYDEVSRLNKSSDLKLALNRLIQLCEETDQAAKAAQWKQELADFQKREAGSAPGPGAAP